MDLVRVPCAAIKTDPQGSNYPTDEADELVKSIRDKGLLRPIVVRQAGDGYVIVHGERRWRAVQVLGHDHCCVVGAGFAAQIGWSAVAIAVSDTECAEGTDASRLDA